VATSGEPPGAGATRAKLFWNGRSQAVRLPKEFRFEGQTEVSVRRDGEKVILEPLASAGRGWPRGYWERLRELRSLFRDFRVPEPLAPGGAEVDLDRS
jgi:virulence-associated protein VagC